MKLDVDIVFRSLQGIRAHAAPGFAEHMFVNTLESSGHCMYHQVQHSAILRSYHTDCIYVFCVDLRTNNDYFPIQN